MFINEYLMDKKLYREFVLKINAKVMFIVAIIYILICGVFFYFTFDKLFLICGLVILAVFSIYPFVLVDKYLKRALELNGGELKKTVVTITDKIYMDEGSNHLEFTIDQIKRVKETKNLMFLGFKSKSGIVIYKDGFTTGTLEEFKEFLKIKGLY